jgi:hypothetical protein
MSEETTPSATPSEQGEQKKTIVDVPEMPVVVDKDVEQQAAEDGSVGTIEAMVNYLKRYNGYNVCSICRIEQIPKDMKQWSTLLYSLFKNYIMRPNATEEEFRKVFVDKHTLYVMVHQVDSERGYPSLAPDGCYTAVSLDKTYIKTIIVGAMATTTPDTFQPCMVVRNGPGKIGEPGTLGLIQGDPYHHVTPAEVAEVIKMTQPEAVAKPAEEAK